MASKIIYFIFMAWSIVGVYCFCISGLWSLPKVKRWWKKCIFVGLFGPLTIAVTVIYYGIGFVFVKGDYFLQKLKVWEWFIK